MEQKTMEQETKGQMTKKLDIKEQGEMMTTCLVVLSIIQICLQVGVIWISRKCLFIIT